MKGTGRRSFEKAGKKLVIIGLDGVPFELISTFTKSGVMPNLGEILDQGKMVHLSAPLPEISSVSWSSFMTGSNPGEHGIFGFVDIGMDTYGYRFPDFRDLRCRPFFDALGDHGIRSVIINLPFTYPAREIPGVLISGFVVPELKHGVYPRLYLEMLEKFGYEVDVDAGKGKDRKQEFLSDLHYLLKLREQVADFLWIQERWDLFMLTITGTDRLHHFMFDAFSKKGHEFHQEFLHYYSEVDRLIGAFYDRIRGKEEFEIILLSDHGFVDLEMEIYLSSILMNSGFFKTESKGPATLENISSDARAFLLDPSRIYIHLKGKFPRGNVSQSDYHRICSEIRYRLEEYRIESRPVFKRIFFKEEIYSGPMMNRAPDLVLLSHPGFDLKAGYQKTGEYGSTHFRGMHCFDNAFLYSSRPELLEGDMSMTEVRDHIFRLLGINC